MLVEERPLGVLGKLCEPAEPIIPRRIMSNPCFCEKLFCHLLVSFHSVDADGVLSAANGCF